MKNIRYTDLLTLYNVRVRVHCSVYMVKRACTLVHCTS